MIEYLSTTAYVAHTHTTHTHTDDHLLCVTQAFAWMGFAIGVVWIYVIANEIVNLLQVSIASPLPSAIQFNTRYSNIH